MASPEENLSPRNAWLRQKTSGVIRSTTETLHKTFPNLTANEITALGVIGVAAGAALALKDKKVLALGILGASSALDAYDGSLARLIAEENPEKKNPHGQLIDTVADRIQEGTLAVSRMIKSQQNGDKLGEALALGSAISNGLPSLGRAAAEARGRTVSESGKNIIGFFGTRTGRTITGLASTVFPEIRGVPVQKILDGANIAANVVTAYDRFKTASAPIKEAEPIQQEIIEDAEVRTMVLAGTAGATILVAGITYAVGNQKTA